MWHAWSDVVGDLGVYLGDPSFSAPFGHEHSYGREQRGYVASRVGGNAAFVSVAVRFVASTIVVHPIEGGNL